MFARIVAGVAASMAAPCWALGLAAALGCASPARDRVEDPGHSQSHGDALPADGAARAPSSSLDWPDVSSPIEGAADGGRDAAVIVAIEHYAFLPTVPGAIDNGRDWFTYLTRSRQLPIERVRFLTDAEATDFAISRALEDASSLAQTGGRVWFIFIGHGAPSSTTQDGLLVTADAQQTVEGLENRSLPRATALRLLSKSAATPIALIDACFSGRRQDGEALITGLQPSRVVPTAVPAGAVLLTAAASNEYAGPLPGAARPAFSYLALGALRGWGDSNADGSITAQEVAGYSRGVLTTLLAGARTQTPDAEGQRSLPVARAAERGPDVGELLLEMKLGKARPAPPVRCPDDRVWDGQACVPSEALENAHSEIARLRLELEAQRRAPAALPPVKPTADSELEPERAKRASPAKLNFASTPPSNVVLDGRVLGSTPIWNVSVEPGLHRLIFIFGAQRKRKVVNAQPGSSLTISETF